MGILQGLLGNLSEVSVDVLKQEYNTYLMDGEEIFTGFKLLRDVVIFTDRRIINFDKQGTTGTKMRVSSVYISSVIGVSAETAGFGLDDSEITVIYMTSPYYKAHGGASVAERTYEFPKKFNIQPLYKWLQEIAFENHKNLNK